MTIQTEILFDYQQSAAIRIQEQRSVLLADQPGLGKTLEVIGALELDGLLSRPANILILTPIINAQTTWRDTIERFVKPRYKVNLIDISKGTKLQKDKQRDLISDTQPNIVLANHNAIDWQKDALRISWVRSLKYDAVIIDESHMVLPIKNHTKLTNFWTGLSKIVLNDNALRIAISGTPDRGKLENRYGTWLFLDPYRTPLSRWDWLEENFFMYDQQVSRTRTIRVPGRLKKPELWLAKDRAMMIRRTKQEVLPQLPPKRYVDVELDLHPEQINAYYVMQMESQEKIFKAREQERDTAEAMVFALRSRQLATCSWQAGNDGKLTPVIGGKSAKLDWLLEFLDERGYFEHDDMADNSSKIVISSQFSQVLHWLKEELTLRHLEVVVLDGATPANKRDEYQRRFQDKNDALRIILLSGNMGVGINLDAADDLIMLDSPYDPDRIEQIEDRVHRASSNHHVTIWNVIAFDTIDQAIAEEVSSRYRTTRTIMDGSRGVTFARRVMDVIRKERTNA